MHLVACLARWLGPPTISKAIHVLQTPSSILQRFSRSAGTCRVYIFHLVLELSADLAGSRHEKLTGRTPAMFSPAIRIQTSITLHERVLATLHSIFTNELGITLRASNRNIRNRKFHIKLGSNFDRSTKRNPFL
jgi:hypothetical protein